MSHLEICSSTLECFLQRNTDSEMVVRFILQHGLSLLKHMKTASQISSKQATVRSAMPNGKSSSGSYFPAQTSQHDRSVTPTLSGSSEEEDLDKPLTTPSMTKALASPIDAETYLSSLHSLRSSSRSNSVYSLSRISLSSQLSQLTALALPDPTLLAPSISAIPTATAAANTLNSAAEQIKKWLQKAKEVLSGLDAEDDVEWAAAGGREGLGEVDAAISRFEALIGVYVSAIEDLQEREDVSKVPSEQLKDQVDQMEIILMDWEGVRRSLKEIKYQVDLALEWEELWNVVLGDIGLEMENLSRLVFEMEEARHRAVETALDGNGVLDMQELDTIVEEAPGASDKPIAQKLKLASNYPPSSPLSPALAMPQDDSRLLALFARMQPLRASLDFLPMTLSSFHTRAGKVLPSACQELEGRRKSLEKRWSDLEDDAQGLRQELGEDRWVLVFRNAGRQAQKLCESVERSILKLQEAIDVGTQHRNPPVLAKKVEAYEAKKSHYGPAIKKVLAIIEKGVTDRQTVNGEILRVHLDTKARWQNIETDMKNMDLALDDMSANKNQQLRDSISSIVSIDRSATGSIIDTPGSSPASSVAVGPANGSKRDVSPAMNASSRRNSNTPGSSTRPNGSKRYFSLPPGSHLPRTSNIRTFTSDPISRSASPSVHSKTSSTATLSTRGQRSLPQSDNKPRWNSSPRVDYLDYSSKPRPYPFATPPNLRRTTSGSFRSPSSAGSHLPSSIPLPSPLGRSSPVPSLPFSTPLTHRPRLSSGSQSSMTMRRGSAATIASLDRTPPSSSNSARKANQASPGIPAAHSDSGTPTRPRPLTSMCSSRRISMLPVPTSATSSPLSHGLESGRQTSFDMNRTMNRGRISSLGNR